ncbi:MAG TPA: hypothetical protein VN455_04820 [Methanotrichaceae archaeon]|nr:hypothetical protein [Methanotrichaceae archaeon]
MQRISYIWSVLAALAVLASAAGGAPGERDVQDQKQKITGAAVNLTSYAYEIDAAADVHLSNSTYEGQSNITSHTDGAVDIAKGMAALSVTNRRDGKVAREHSSYLINGTLYSGAGRAWQKQAVPNSTLAMRTFDEMRGQSGMLSYSDMALEGSGEAAGRDSLKAVSTPPESIRGMLIRGQIIGAYFTLTGRTLNLTMDDVIKNSRLMNQSTVRLTSWIDRESGLLLKNEMDVELNATPEVLSLPGGESLEIDMTQTSVFRGFDQPSGIELPEAARDAVSPANESKKDCPFCNKEITA